MEWPGVMLGLRVDNKQARLPELRNAGLGFISNDLKHIAYIQR
jgi:hypothetical protein